MDKHLLDIESWLQNYLIIDRRIESLYRQSQRPHLRDTFLKMGPKGDKNMAVNTERTNVAGGHGSVPWAVGLESILISIGAISEDITRKIQLCLAEQSDMLCVVGRAGLTQEEALYVEQRYFEGISVSQMEREGCGRTRLASIKQSALEKIYDARHKTAETVVNGA